MNTKNDTKPELLIEMGKVGIYSTVAPILGDPHAHEQHFQLIYIVNATGSVVIEDQRYTAQKDDLYLIPPGHTHWSTDDENTCPELWELRFRFLRQPGGLPFDIAAIPIRIPSAGWPDILETIHQIIDEHSSQRELSEWILSMLVLELLGKLWRLARMTGNTTKRYFANQSQIAEAARYIHLHYAEPLTLAQLARICYLSPSRFCHNFRRVYGKSPINYLIDVRIQRACEMIRDGRLSLTQIAENVGLGSIHYMSRVFRNRKGVPPSHYIVKSG